MDVLIFSGFLTLSSVLILVGIFGPRVTLLFSGTLFVLLGLMMANEPITQSVVVSYNQSNFIQASNNTAWENLSSNFQYQTGTSYNIRQFPAVVSYNRTYMYEDQALMNRSWQYGLLTSGFGFGLVVLGAV